MRERIAPEAGQLLGAHEPSHRPYGASPSNSSNEGVRKLVIITALIGGLLMLVSSVGLSAALRVSRSEAHLGAAVVEIPGLGTKQSVVFVHIPKNGGSAIERWAAQYGVQLGRCLAGTGMPYRVANKFACSTWHIPPAETAPNSFCIKRNPYTRYASEFDYRRTWRR